MKKELIVVLSLIALFIVGSFLFIPKNHITGNAISPITLPTDCLASSISSLWDSIFIENSTGISFVFDEINATNNQCDNFIAAKTLSNNESYLLWSVSDVDQTGKYSSLTIAIKTKFNSSKINYSSLVKQELIDDPSKRDSLYVVVIPIPEIVNRSNSINTELSAVNEFYSVFNETLNIQGFVQDGLTYKYSETENYLVNANSFSRSLEAYLYKNLSDQYLAYKVEGSVPNACVPNWTRQESVCYSNETKVIFYSDSNSCNNLTGKPSPSILNCDSNANGVIGEILASQNSLNLSVYIAGSLFNSSFNYSNSSSQRLVEIQDDGKIVLSFMYSFTEPLVLNNITLKLNSNSSEFGYILINGLDEDKYVIFDKKNSSSSQVCVRDEYVSSISDISDFCEDDNEYLVSCPGFSAGYSCNISNNTFNVAGLEHSAVKEMILTQNISPCVQNWSCTEWSNCTNFMKTRSCNDTARCNNLTGKPNITESCVPGDVVTPSCVPQWSCTEWYPEKCYGENQTRSCTDLNKCNSNENKPLEAQECSSSLKTYFLWATIILFSLLVCLVIFYLISKNLPKKEVPKVESPNSDSPKTVDSPSSDVQPSSQADPVPAQTSVAPEIPDVNKK